MMFKLNDVQSCNFKLGKVLAFECVCRELGASLRRALQESLSLSLSSNRTSCCWVLLSDMVTSSIMPPRLGVQTGPD